MAIRNIRKMGDEVLRKPSKEIKEMYFQDHAADRRHV